MPKREFDFLPPVRLILTHLPTIRKIDTIYNDGMLTAELERFLKHLAVRIREEIPEVNTWESEIPCEALFFFPGKSWRVVKDDHIAVCVHMQQCVEPEFNNDVDDPFVGLYVPKWKHLQSFTNHLKGLHIPGFEHISEHEESDMIDNFRQYPLWSTVHLTPLVKQSTLDVDGLERAIVDRVRKLVVKEDKITTLISKLRPKAV